jgi:hypothetical protein
VICFVLCIVLGRKNFNNFSHCVLDMLYVEEIRALVKLHEMYVNYGMRGKILYGICV